MIKKDIISLAPMAGVTDIAFRILAKRYGADLTFTEFINSRGLLRNKNILEKRIKEEPGLRGVQLFGNNEEDIEEAGKFVKDYFDIVDINVGCPVHKVIKTGAGSALLKDLNKIKKIVERLTKHIDIVSVKIRIGIDEKRINALEIAKTVEEAGASILTIHGRTQKQMYSGEANWDIIKKVKENSKLYIIGNGDIYNPEIAYKRKKETNVDGIMIGRAAMKYPYIFTQIKEYFKNNQYSEKNRIEIMEEYLELAREYDVKINNIKNHIIQISKGLRYGKTIREEIIKTKKIEEIEEIIKNIKKYINKENK